MKTILSALSDGSLSGVARWYAENHARRCPGCGSALTDLKTIRERIRTLGIPDQESLHLTEGQWSTMEAAWEQMDQQGT